MSFRVTLAGMLALVVAGPALSATWADGMFDELSRDFGSVPKGPTVSHHFHLKNNTGKVVTIGNVRVSCGCVSAVALKSRLNPGEDTSVYAQMDTNKFSGSRTVTIYVRFDDPQYEEVRLWVTANSREDFTVGPETFDFGQIKRGDSPSKSVKVTFLGSGQTQILDASSESNYVQPSFKELRRSDAYVEYQLNAKVRPDVPAGKWYTDVWMKTNNASLPKIRVQLYVEVTSALDLNPNSVQLGELKTGAQAERRVVLRGIQPFKVKEIQGADDQVQVVDSTEETKQVHVLIVTLKATHVADINRTIKIVTDLKEGNEIEFQVKGKVLGEAKEPVQGKLFGRRKQQRAGE
jgi:hypothetical protein